MDIKHVILNGHINEGVCVSQPSGFEDHDNPDHVLKLKRGIYGLKQALRAWCEKLSGFFYQTGIQLWEVNTTLFIRHKEKHILLV